jgi:two-component system chemotaxis response regulator CheV
MEILELIISGQSFGINVVQVSEILSYHPLTPVPNAHPHIEGIFMPRGTTITAIDLKKSLNMGESGQDGSFIVTQYKNMEIALHADEIIGIHRVLEGDLTTVEETGILRKDGYIESVLKVDEKLIEVLNFYKIISEVNPDAINKQELEA